MNTDDGGLLSLLLEWEDRRGRGEPATPESLCADRPELLEEFRRAVRALGRFEEDFETPSEDSTTDFGSEPNPAEEPTVREHIDRYRVERFLAKGGLGEVHVATDAELGRRIALKRIKASRASDSTARRRFLREAMITAALEHPGIVPVHGLVHDSKGRPFYAMRLIDGESLLDALLRLHGKPRPDAPRVSESAYRETWTVRELLRRFVAACEAVAFAHSRGVVHRDLKPANIMLGPFGETYVVDWGLATAIGRSDAPPAPSPSADADPSPLDPTLARGIVGTPAFMAPEQAEDPLAAVAPAADVYSLGATLEMILTGVAPSRSADGRPVASPRSVPPALRAVIRKATAPAPENRYAGAKELAEDVSRWLDGDVVSAYPEPWTDRLARWTRKHRTAVVAAGCIGAVGMIAWIVLANRELEARGRIALNAMRAGNALASFADRDLARLDPYGLDWIRRNFARTFASSVTLDLPTEENDDLAFEQAREGVLSAGLRRGESADDAEARRNLDRADAILARLARRAGRTPRILGLMSRSAELRAENAKAVAICDELLAAGSIEPELRVEAHIRSAHCLRTLTHEAKSRDDQLRLIDRAAAQADLARAERPDSTEAARVRAAVLTQRYAVVSDRSPRYDDPARLAARRAAVEASLEWMRLAPNSPEIIQFVAEMGLNPTDILNDPDFVAEMAGIRERFLAEFALSRQSLTQVVRGRSAEGDAMMRAGRFGEATAAFRRAIEVGRTLRLSTAKDNDFLVRQAYFQALVKLSALVTMREAPPLLAEALTAYEGLEDRSRYAEAIAHPIEVAFTLAETRFRTGSPDRSDFDRFLARVKEARSLFPPADPNWAWIEPMRVQAEERLRRLDALASVTTRLPAVARGTDTPRNAEERELMAMAAFGQRMPALAARLWEEFLKADPAAAEDIEKERRLLAAIAAVTAGCGEDDGALLDDNQRARLRRLGLRWMEEELAAWSRVRLTDDPVKRELYPNVLLAWSIHGDLNRARDPKALEALPEPERAGWRDFWRRVAYLQACERSIPLPENVFAR